MIGGKGGPARVYVIYRREQPQGGGALGNWEQAGMVLETHALFTHQLRHARPPARGTRRGQHGNGEISAITRGCPHVLPSLTPAGRTALGVHVQALQELVKLVDPSSES